MKINDIFLKSTFNRHLIPTMLGILGGTVTVFFDSILIGNIVGEEGLLAVNLCLPVYLVFCTLGSLIASGAAVLSAQETGRSDMEKSRRIFGSAIVLALALATVFSAAGIVFIDSIVRLLSGGMGLDGLRGYALITICAGVPKVLLYIPFFYLRLDGRSGQAMAVMLLMTILNVVLDALLMACFPMGIAGAAYANAAATLAACVIGYFLLLKKGSGFALPVTPSRPPAALGILKTGTPSALNNLASALRILVINTILLSLAADGAYPVIFAVVTAVSEFSLFLINGIPQTALPILSVYSVEQSNAAIRLLMKRQIITGTAAIGAFGLGLAAFHGAISGIFGVSQNILIPLACLGASLVLGQINSIMAHYFNAVGRIFLANIITVLRIVMMPALIAWLLAATRGGPIWLFLPLSELAALLAWLGAVSMLSGRSTELSRILLLDDVLEKSGNAVDFSVKSDPAEICYASKRITEFCENNHMTPKQTMRISLAIEEIMTVMAERSIGNAEGSFDVRAFSAGGTIALRIRCAGARFNPLSLCDGDGDSEADEKLMGIKMLSGMVKKLQYISTFGVNSFFVQVQ